MGKFAVNFCAFLIRQTYASIFIFLLVTATGFAADDKECVSRWASPSDLANAATGHGGPAIEAAANAEKMLRDAGYEKVAELDRGGEAVIYRVEKDGVVQIAKVPHRVINPIIVERQEQRLRAAAGFAKELTSYEKSLAAADKTGNFRKYYLPTEFHKKEGEKPFLTAPLVQQTGESGSPDLFKILDRKKLTMEQKIEIIDHILTAVGRAEDLGIINRDLKPANILVTFDEKGHVDQLKIIDFELGSYDGDYPLGRRTENISGTNRYMSGGQWRNEPGSKADNVANLRQVMGDILVNGNRDAPAMQRTILGVVAAGHAPTYFDRPRAPVEFARENPLVALAAWSRIPKNAHEQRQLLNVAVANGKTPAKFFEYLGNKIENRTIGTDVRTNAKIDHHSALEILESKELIEAFFDNTLKLSDAKRTEILRGVYGLYDVRPDADRIGPLAPSHPYLFFKEFKSRLARAREAGAKLVSDETIYEDLKLRANSAARNTSWQTAE